MSTSATDSAADARLTAVVYGGVQGVGYRFFARAQARALGLRGYVRNQSGGTVEVVAEGPRATLDHLLTVLRRGPAAAWVSGVETRWSPAEQTFTSFTIQH
jgi:acylphosphatase